MHVEAWSCAHGYTATCTLMHDYAFVDTFPVETHGVQFETDSALCTGLNQNLCSGHSAKAYPAILHIVRIDQGS
jgi:hypothetical protein